MPADKKKAPATKAANPLESLFNLYRGGNSKAGKALSTANRSADKNKKRY